MFHFIGLGFGLGLWLLIAGLVPGIHLRRLGLPAPSRVDVQMHDSMLIYLTGSCWTTWQARHDNLQDSNEAGLSRAVAHMDRARVVRNTDY